MAKYLPLAIATAAIVATQIAIHVASRDTVEPIVQAEWLEGIHVDMRAQKLNVTVGAEGERTTIVFSPRAATQTQLELGRTFAVMLQGAEKLHAQQKFRDQFPEAAAAPDLPAE